MREGNQRIETRAMVIEVPKDYRELINDRMMSFKLHNCENMTYVLFSQMADESYNSTLKQIFLSQNVYLHRTQRRNIHGISDPISKFATKDGTEVSFCEWIESITYGNKSFLDACVVGPTGTLHLIYDEVHGNTVQELFGKGFKEYAQEHFCEKDLQKIFAGEKMRIGENQHGPSKIGGEYAEYLKRKFQGNSQDTNDVMRYSDTAKLSYAEASRSPPQRHGRMNLHYSKFSESSTIELNHQPKKTRTETVQTAQERESFNVLLKRLEKLETNVTNSHSAPTTWENALNDRLQDHMNKFQKQFESKLSALETQTEQRMQKSEKLILQQLNEMQAINTQSITNSFTSQMSQVNGKLDKYMTMFMAKLESTGTIEHHRGAIVAGKCI